MGTREKPNGNPRAFLSYCRKDGAEFTVALRKRLEREHPEITLWQDLSDLKPEAGWWNQITEALDRVQFIVIVMTPGALESPITRKEWQYARQQGVSVCPVKGAPGIFDLMPQWMRKKQFLDLDLQWDIFVNFLKSTPERVRVPFMAPEPPETFIERPDEFGQLLEHLLSPDRENPIAITTALLGAGGFGKTTLAAKLCHHDDVITAFDDGILWATLGETPNVRDALIKLHNALTGESATFNDIEEAARNFAEKIADRNCLVVIDDVWNAAHLRPFLRGGKGCARLVTTRNLDVVLEAAAETRRVNVDEMKVPEAVQMLIAHLEPRPTNLEPLEALAQRLGEWPLLLGLVNAALRERINVRHDSFDGALRHINQTLDRRDLTAFDRTNPGERNDAVTKSIGVSLELLESEQCQRYYETGIFPEDTDVPLTTLSALWGLDDFETQELAGRLDKFSLLKLNLETGTAHLHDVLRGYLMAQLPDPPAVHENILKAWDIHLRALDSYAWRHVAYHLVAANRTQDLRRLLLDFNWLQAKLDATDPNALIADYDYLPNDPDLRFVQDAIRLSSHVLANDRAQLASQLVGRLLDTPGASIQALVAKARPLTRCWLRPLHGRLTPPGGPLLRTLVGHSSSVCSVAVTSDGRRAISTSEDRTLKVWDLENGHELRTLKGHSGFVISVAITSDGCRAISASDDHTLKVWDLGDGRELCTLEGHSGRVNSVAVTPDGRNAVSASDDRTLKVWNLEDGRELRTLEGHSGGVHSVTVAPGGSHALSASSDHTLKVWDLEDGRVLRTLEGHSGGVHSVTVAPGGSHALSASWDKTLKVWDLEDGRVLRTLEGHSGWVHSVAVTPDGCHAVSASGDGTLRVWNLEDGCLLRTLEGHSNWVNSVAVTPDGKRAVSASDDKTLKIWDIEDGRVLRAREGHSGSVYSIAVTPDGCHAVSASRDKTLKVWDIEDGCGIRTLEGHSSEVASVAVTPDGKRAVSASDDKTLKVWDLKDGRELCTLEGHSSEVASVAVTPDGSHAVSASLDNTVKVWDLKDGHLLRTLKGHFGPVTSVAVTPDGSHAVSASSDHTVKVWDLEDGRELRTLEDHSSEVASVAVTPDGSHAVFASSDHIVKVWDIEDGRELRTLEGHSEWVRSVAVTHDGSHAVSVSSDNTLKVWDLKLGQLLATFTADAPVHACTVAPDGVTIVAGDASGRVHFLRLEEPCVADPLEHTRQFRLLERTRGTAQGRRRKGFLAQSPPGSSKSPVDVWRNGDLK